VTTITFNDVLEIIVVAALGSYFIVGLAVLCFVIARRPKRPDRPLPRGMLWEPKNHEWNTRWWFLMFTSNHPLLIVLHVIVWPLWFMAYLDSIEAEEENTPTQYLGPSDDEQV
jgi:hypothetical protein